MKLRRDFILFSNPNKPPPKFKNDNEEANRVFEKIPAQTLQEMPQIRKAFRPEKKPYINGIKKDLRPEHIRIEKQMSESDVKIFTKINDMKDLVYEIDNGEDDEENEAIAEENRKFSKNYKKLKKDKNKFNRGTYLDYEPFLNISSQYVAKNMKVPNLSEDHNLFSANPLILQGSELENYIVYNLGDKTKGVNFLNRLDEYLEKKLSGDTKVSIKEMERLEKLKKEEKPKGYIPPEVEITMLKNDISNCEKSYKNLVDLEEFFKPKKKNFRSFTLKKNKSSLSVFNNSLDRSPTKIFGRKISENVLQNNSLVTATTSIGVTRKSSPKVDNKNNLFNLNNLGMNLPKEYQFKLPKLETPIKSPSSIFNNSKNYVNTNKLKIRKISFNSNMKLEPNSLSRNNELSPIFNSMHNNIKEINNRFKKEENNNKMYQLLKLSRKNSKSEINKKENENMTTESELDDINELNKQIGNNNFHKLSINKDEEIKEKEENDESTKNQNNIENKNEKKEEENKENNNDDNKNKKERLSNYGNKKPKKAKIEKLRIINKENAKNKKSHKSNSIINLVMPKINSHKDINNQEKEKENKSCDAIKVDPNEIRYRKIENLFNVIKEKSYNEIKKDTKRDIESYLGSRGKNVKKMLSTKGTYYAFHNLMKKSKDRNIILEEYMIRNRFNVKEPLTTKQKIILDKNSGFVKEIIKQESKFNEILYKGEKQQE